MTVAEVIELGLERFGILEGVVDGGDEVEDKFTKRRSSIRVRYQLVVDTGHNGMSSCISSYLSLTGVLFRLLLQNVNFLPLVESSTHSPALPPIEHQTANWP